MKLNIISFVFLVIFSLFSSFSNANVRYWKIVITERYNTDKVIDTVWFKTVPESENNGITTTVFISSSNGSFANHFPDLNGYQVESIISGKHCNFIINGQQGPSHVMNGEHVLNEVTSLSHNYFGQAGNRPDFIIPIFPLVQSNPLSLSTVSLGSNIHEFHFYRNRKIDDFKCLWCETFLNEMQQRRWGFHWANGEFGYTLREISESEIDS